MNGQVFSLKIFASLYLQKFLEDGKDLELQKVPDLITKETMYGILKCTQRKEVMEGQQNGPF